eukprot:363336-Chlamydomonas_euryale.AAC.5
MDGCPEDVHVVRILVAACGQDLNLVADDGRLGMPLGVDALLRMTMPVTSVALDMRMRGATPESRDPWNCAAAAAACQARHAAAAAAALLLLLLLLLEVAGVLTRRSLQGCGWKPARRACSHTQRRRVVLSAASIVPAMAVTAAAAAATSASAAAAAAIAALAASAGRVAAAAPVDRAPPLCRCPHTRTPAPAPLLGQPACLARGHGAAPARSQPACLARGHRAAPPPAHRAPPKPSRS